MRLSFYSGFALAMTVAAENAKADEVKQCKIEYESDKGDWTKLSFEPDLVLGKLFSPAENKEAEVIYPFEKVQNPDDLHNNQTEVVGDQSTQELAQKGGCKARKGGKKKITKKINKKKRKARVKRIRNAMAKARKRVSARKKKIVQMRAKRRKAMLIKKRKAKAQVRKNVKNAKKKVLAKKKAEIKRQAIKRRQVH